MISGRLKSDRIEKSEPMNNKQSLKKTAITRFLDFIEKTGNKLPDPAILFFFLMLLVWVLSALLSTISFAEIDPRTGSALQVRNLLDPVAIVSFFENMVATFTGFAPLGIVLVAMLGVGVADYSGFINAGLKTMLGF